MNKKYLYPVLVAILIALAVGVFIKTRSNNTTEPASVTTLTEASTSKDESTIVPSSTPEAEKAKAPTSSSTPEASDIDKIIKSQKVISDLLVSGITNDEQRVSRLLDVMAPLGVLDPYATENNPVTADSALLNQLFGYYGNKIGLSKDKILAVADLPLSYGAASFDSKDYFKQNKSILEDIRGKVTAMPKLKILAYWTSGIGRVNETYNASIGFWKQDKISGKYYDTSNVRIATTPADADAQAKSSTAANLDPEEILNIVNLIASINVTVTYKCGGNLILIMGGTTDNAAGFIYGAPAKSVNCGYLGNRFDIFKEVKLDDNWTYWVGR